jgi:hypothetical protein
MNESGKRFESDQAAAEQAEADQALEALLGALIEEDEAAPEPEKPDSGEDFIQFWQNIASQGSPEDTDKK